MQSPQNSHDFFTVSQVLQSKKSGDDGFESWHKNRLTILQNFAHSIIVFYLCWVVVVGYNRDFEVELLKRFDNVQSNYFCTTVNGEPRMNYNGPLHYRTLRSLRLSLRDRIYVFTNAVSYEL